MDHSAVVREPFLIGIGKHFSLGMENSSDNLVKFQDFVGPPYPWILLGYEEPPSLLQGLWISGLTGLKHWFVLLFIKIPIYHGHISIIRHKAVQFLFMAHQTFYTAHILQNLTKYHKTEENRKNYFWIPVGGPGFLPDRFERRSSDWSFRCSLHQHTVHEKLTGLKNHIICKLCTHWDQKD